MRLSYRWRKSFDRSFPELRTIDPLRAPAIWRVHTAAPVSGGKMVLSFQFGQIKWKMNALMHFLIVAEIIYFARTTKFLQRPGRGGLFGNRMKDGDSVEFPIKQFQGYNLVGSGSVRLMALLAFWTCPRGSRPDAVAVSRPRECRQLCCLSACGDSIMVCVPEVCATCLLDTYTEWKYAIRVRNPVKYLQGV